MTSNTDQGRGPASSANSSAALPLFVGTYTERLGHVDGKAEGVLQAAFVPATGVLSDSGATLLARTRNPSWVAVDASAGLLYAVNEGGAGTVSAFRLADGEPVGAPVDSRGEDPCHLSLSADGRFVLVANYSSGTVAAFPRRSDGGLDEASAVARHSGSSVDPRRQTAPHPHMVFVDPVTGRVLVPDLGLDAVVGYELGGEGTLTEVFRVAVPAGSGPRHLVAGPDGGRERLYLVNELANTVIPLTRTGDDFAAGEPVSTLPEGFDGDSGTAAIRITPSGRTLLVSNRGHDSIAVLGIEPGSGPARPAEAAGTPVLRTTVPARGAGPRDIRLSPDGRYLLVACQDSGLLHTFVLDEDAESADALLRHVQTAEVATPVCLAFG